MEISYNESNMAGRYTFNPDCKPAHQVTPEMMFEGNELLVRAKVAGDRAIHLQQTADTLERLKEAAWAEAKRCRLAASKLMVGPDVY